MRDTHTSIDDFLERTRKCGYLLLFGYPDRIESYNENKFIFFNKNLDIVFRDMRIVKK